MDRWLQVEKLYQQAKECSDGDRPAFLEAACGGDAKLRQDVETLLATGIDDVSFLRTSGLDQLARGLVHGSPRIAPGERLGAYTIVSLLGEGGMGQVYLAQDARLGRKVAIKIVSKEFTELFGREARAISTLNHPHICTLYDVGPDFLVMEFIEGQTLSERMREGPLSVQEVLHYGAQIAEALAEAHAHAIVHRDLKPGNIMLRAGNVKVLDFGMAKFTEAPDGDLTRAHVVMGTPAYMAPEQFEGKPSSSATDLFSLGLVLYEMTTGKIPFPGASLGTILAQRPETSIEAPCRGRSKIPSRLNRLILGLLERDPTRRPQNAATIRQELLELGKPSRFKPASIAVSAAILVLAIAGVWRRQHRTPPQRWPEASRVSMVTTYPGNEVTPSVSPDGKLIAFSWDGGDDGHQDIYVTRLDVQEAPQRRTHDLSSETADVFPAWSPDGQQIAFVRRTGGRAGQLIIMPAAGGPERKLRDIQSSQARLAWSPDSRELVFSSESLESGRATLFRIRLADGAVRTLSSPPDGTVGDGLPAISPNGRLLAFVRWSSPAASTVLLQKLGADWKALGMPVTVPDSGPEAGWPAWADDQRLLILDGNKILEWEEGAAPEQVFLSSLPLAGLSIAKAESRSPRVVVAQNSAQTPIMSMIPLRTPGEAAGPPEALPRFGTDIHNPDFSPDGKHIVFASGRSGSSELWTADADGNNLKQLTRLGVMRLGIPRWSPDGRRIAFYARMPDQSSEPEIYVIDAMQESAAPVQITEAAPGCNVPSWSHDGEFLYCSRRTPEMFLYRVSVDSGTATDDRMARWFEGKDAAEVLNQRVLYVKDGRPGLFSRSLAGDPTANAEEQLVNDIRGPIAYYAAVPEGVYYTGYDSNGYAGIRFFSFARHKAFDIASKSVTGRINSLTISPDHKRLIYSRVPDRETDLALIQYQ